MQLDYNLFAKEVENKLPMNNRRVIKEVKDTRNEKSHRKKRRPEMKLDILYVFWTNLMKISTGAFDSSEGEWDKDLVQPTTKAFF